MSRELTALAAVVWLFAHAGAARGATEAKPLIISDVWTHVGETSAVLSCVTSRAARVTVEYGQTNRYGSKTAGDAKPRFVHIVRLRGLEPGKTVHCRIVAAAGRQKQRSKAITVKAARIDGAVRLPGKLPGPPYVLDKPGATYVLTKDITTDGTAFKITANGVRLELDGHTVRHGKDLAWKDPAAKAGRMRMGGGHGVFFPTYGTKKPVIVNGVFEEATPKQAKTANGFGHNAVAGNGVSGLELAGVTIVYSGRDIRGVQLANSGKAEIHHCVFDDRGRDITNRHQGLDAICGLGGSKIHHNLIRRVRHRGILAGSKSDIHHNEIHCDSWATNAYGVMCYATQGAAVHHNWIFGGGYHLIGIGTVSNCRDVEVHHNHIELTGSEPMARWSEYGKMSGMNGVRTTWGGTNLVYHHNTIIITGTGGANLRGTWFSSAENVKGLVFRDNFVRVVALDGKAHVRGAIAACGDYRKPDHAVVLYKGNRIVSNVTNVRFGEGYGLGSNHHFVGNTFVREGRDGRYATVRIGYWDKPTRGHVLQDCRFEGGAGLDKVRFQAAGDRDFTVKWTVTFKVIGPGGKPVADAEVSVVDKAGKDAFRGRTDAKGEAAAVLAQYLAKADGKTPYTPHTATVKADALAPRTLKVTADAARTVQVRMEKP